MDVRFIWGNNQQQALQALKDKLCTAPCLAYPNYNKGFHLEVGFSGSCRSAGLNQVHDSDKRVVAYSNYFRADGFSYSLITFFLQNKISNFVYIFPACGGGAPY